LDVIRRSNDCEYIVKFHGYLITYGNLYICMELMATCLERLIKRLNTGFPIAVIGKIAVSVIKGLNYLKEQHAYTMSIGCVAYLAPERISVRQPYDVRSDVWSFGLTLFYLTTGTFPYENDNLLALMIRICQDPPPILNNELFPLELCEFIRLCLQKDPNYRPRYRELSQQIFYREHVNNEFNVADWLANNDDIILEYSTIPSPLP
uniref:mitogen-activated protein kinase kinase n=1 Tax=Acrobeloides nanus TaxID=290746 RepID=A0A914DB13_9BILA